MILHLNSAISGFTESGMQDFDLQICVEIYEVSTGISY